MQKEFCVLPFNLMKITQLQKCVSHPSYYPSKSQIGGILLEENRTVRVLDMALNYDTELVETVKADDCY